MDTPRSAQFDDIYFSPEDGFAETQHVFIMGNNLPGAWEGRARFTIAETGFGTGLNFLAAWERFAATAKPGQVLDYISYEKYPLSREEIGAALARWNDPLGPFLENFLAHYPPRITGAHRMDFGTVRLTLIFDDINRALPSAVIPAGVDAWFLDGFAPAKNPDMWTQIVFDAMARHSAPGATFATFTAAGAVRRGLEEAGFEVQKTAGFGRKRDMTTGRFKKEAATQINANKPNRIAIVGGGLAGTACAHALKGAGASCVIFENAAALAPDASGNRTGIFNPRLSALRSPEADFYSAAFSQALAILPRLPDIALRQHGSLHLVTDADRRKKFAGTVASWGWHEDHMKMLDAAQASALAGVSVAHDALWLPDSGSVSPEKLCHALAAGAEVRLNARADSIKRNAGWQVNGESFDAVILACGAAVKNFAQGAALPVHTVRGQVTYAGATEASRRLGVNLCYGGYIAPAQDGMHTAGATFQRWRDDAVPAPEDDADNLARLRAAVPEIAAGMTAAGARAALRCSSLDRFPIIGRLDENLYVSTAHGSHGILSALAGAGLIADMMRGDPYRMPARVIEALAPERFAKRAQRRNLKYSRSN